MESNVAFGAEGYRFVKMFPGASGKDISISGIVDGITGTGMRKCSFTDGKNHTFSLSHMKRHCNKNYNPREGISDDGDDSLCSGSEANIEEEDADTSCSDASQNNNALDVVDLDAVVGNESDEVDKTEEEFVISKGKYFYELIKLPLVDLRARGTAQKALAKAMEYPINQITDRFRQLTLSGRPVKVTKWPASEKLKELENALKKFDPSYTMAVTSWKGLEKKMPVIFEFFNDEKHCRRSEYMFQLRLCGEEGCILCARIGRDVRTPTTANNALRQYALSFVNLPVPNPKDNEHYLSPEDTAKRIINKKLSHDDVQKMLPLLKNGDGESKRLTEDKAIDQKYKGMFKGSKARGIVSCDNCAAPRVIYSMYEQESSAGKGPKKKHMDMLDRFIEDGGYICGVAIPVKLLFNQRKLRCYEPVESMYYCAGTDADQRRGNRVVTKDVCCLCYVGADIAPPDEVKRRQKSAVQNPLPVCRSCLDLNVQVPGGGTNFVKKREQAKAKKVALAKKAVLEKKKRHRGR